jgi:8-oxo-dGTP pyrophosphatase MutT (NUDIX family)
MKNSVNEIAKILDSLKIPFFGSTIGSYHVYKFPQASVSGIGPVIYRNKKTKKIYILLQRRYKDNFQWWVAGGYVELPSHDNFFTKNFQKIKNATIGEYKKNAVKQGWQKSYKEINDPKKLIKILKKHKINWPKEVDFNWQSAWQREVLEETGVDLDKFADRLIFDLNSSKTLTVGVEPDRLVNIDGKFCAFLGELDKAPKIIPDHETEELQWIALDEIFFDKKNFVARGKIINLYSIAIIEEGLFRIICHKIQEISKIINPVTKQVISKFNTPQNLQCFLILNPQIKRSREIKKFLTWEFGELEIGKNLCGKDGDELYKISLLIAETICNF